MTEYEQRYRNKELDYNRYLDLELKHILANVENNDLNFWKSYLKIVIITNSPKGTPDNFLENYSAFTKKGIFSDINRINNLGIKGDENGEIIKNNRIDVDHIKKLRGFVGLFMKIQSEGYGKGKYYQIDLTQNPEYIGFSGGRRNHPKHTDMTMKDIKELCKANQIKLSKVVDDKRVCYKKKELLTKLKRKKVI